MNRRPAATSRRFWIFAACLLLALGALPTHARAQLTLTSFDLGASPNPVPDQGYTTVSAYVGGISQTPTGTVNFYVSASTASCTGSAGAPQIGTGTLNPTGVATVSYYAGTPGIIPVCADYSGDSSYPADTAGVYLLTVEQPPTFTVNVAGAAEANTPVNFGFSLSVPSGQPMPTGTVTLYDSGNGNTYGPVTINSDGSVPSINGITLNNGYYEAVYSGDSNNPAEYDYGDVFQENGLTAIIPDLIAAGSGDTTITLDGLNFDSTSAVQLNINSAVIPLSTTYNNNPNRIQATIPQAYLTNPGSLTIYVYTSDTGITTNNVAVQVTTPNSDAITVSANPQSFAYGTPLGATVAGAVTPSASDGGVPAGPVSFILTGPGVNESIGTAPLSQNPTPNSGAYVSSATPGALDFGSIKILSADFNNDGNFDFVSMPGYSYGAGGSGPYVQVMLSTGANTFATEQEVYVGCVPQDFALGDINNDGHPDIVVACQNPGGSGGFPVAEYLLGNGDGTFQAPVAFASNTIVGLITSPTHVAVGDFNGDGVLDVALVDGVNGNVQVLFGDNPFDGGYNASSVNSFDTSAGQVVNAGAADFNQDGYSDIGLAEYNNIVGGGAVLVLTSNRYGGFNYTEQPFSATTNQLNSMVITDVNGDNYPDIAIAEPGQTNSTDTGQVIVFENAAFGPGNLGTLNSGYSIPATQATDVTGVPFPATGAPSGTPAVAPNWNLLYSSEATGSAQILVTPLQRLGFDNWQALSTITTTDNIPPSDYGTVSTFLTASDVNADGYLDFTFYGATVNYNILLATVDWSNSAATSNLQSSITYPAPGSYSLAASYSGTPLFAGGSSATIPITIAPGTPTGAVTGPSPASATAGASVSLTATVIGVPTGAAPTQNVQFFVNGTAFGGTQGLSLQSGDVATATLTTSSLPIGLDTITASYTGDGNYTALSTTQITSYQIQINGQSFSLGLAGSTANTTAGTMVNFTVTATGSPLPPPEPVTLTGLPTVVTVSPIMTNGIATYNFGQFPPGSYNIQASYAGDGTFLPQTSNIVPLQVGNAPISITPSPSANPVTYPTSINLLATVSGNGLGVPAGSVDFQLDASGSPTDLGSGALSLVNGSSGLKLIGTYGGNTDAALNDIATVSGDFNHDGIPDLAVLQQNSNVTVLQIFIGNGDGTFQPPVLYGQTQNVAPNSATLAAADFNGDGYTDLAIGTSDGSILIFLATADSAGDLAYSQGLTGNAEAGIAVGKFSPGGIPGLAVAGYSTVEVFTQSAPGTFNTTPYYSRSADGPSYAGIAVADFNNDGAPDFAATDSNGDNVAVFLNQPSNPDVPFAVSTYPVGASAGAIAAGDINGDGYPDLAVVSPSDSTVEVLINNQAGGFPIGTPYGVAGQPDAVTMADFNQDGYADIAVAGTQTGQGSGTSILLGSSTGAISGEALLSGTDGKSIASADFNSDTNPDLAVGYNGVTTFLDSASQLALPNILLPAGSDTITATYTPLGESIWAGGNASFVETVNQGTPTIVWPAPGPITYGTALSGTQLDATSPIAGSFTYIPAAGAVLNAGPQTLTAQFAPADTTDYQPATAQVSLTVNQATPSVTWPTPAPITYGTALSGIQLDATSPVQGSFSYTPAVATVLGAGTHTLSVTFTPTDATDYQSFTTTVSLLVNKATTSVTWNEPAAITYPAALTGTQLDAIGSVPGTLNYTPGAGAVLTAGTHTLSVTLTPTDAADYQPSTTTTSILVNKTTAGITWNNPAAITYGTALSAAQLNATASIPGSFSYSPGAGTVLSVGTQPLNVTFTPTDTTNYQASTASVSIVVKSATSSITWSNPAAITYGTALTVTQLDASSTIPGTFTYKPSAGTLLTAGTHTLSVTFAPTDTADYQTSTDSVTIVVNKAATTVNWPNPAAIPYGTALGAAQLDATSAVPGTFVYTPPAGTTLSTGTHSLSVSFTPTDAADYLPSTGSASILVNKATPAIVWLTPLPIGVGTPLSATQLDATATPAGGTFTYDPPLGTILPIGNQTLSVSYKPVDTTDYTTASTTVVLIVGPPLTLSTIAPSSGTLGQAATTITLTGTAFTESSVVQLNGKPIASHFVSSTQMTAVIPASFLSQIQTGHVTVTSNGATTPGLTFTVDATTVQATLSGPSTAQPGEQPIINFTLSQGYSLPLQGTFTLTVQPAVSGQPVDPAVQFSTGGTTLKFTIPANSTTTPTVQIQTGTLAATITVTLTLTADGQNVTPDSIGPVVISVPAVAPVISSVSLVRSGDSITVTVDGFSSTRDMSSATFTFTPASGATLTDSQVTVNVFSAFTDWYSLGASDQYGSAFSYTQTFTLSNSADNIGSVSVTLANSVGRSTPVSAN